MKERILSKIKELEKKHNVKILWAIESGSRAWGFASEDSDYDVRCMHVGKKEDYLGMFPPPEQINLFEEDLDIESWDIKKFAELSLKSNPQIAEWLRSPIVYIGSPVLKKLREIFDKGCSLESLKNHYLGMAKQNYHKYMGHGTDSSCKKYLYVLRALGCAEFISQENKIPPLPYKEVIPYLPKYCQDFFERCVIAKNSTEKATIGSNSQLMKYIESNIFLRIPKSEHEFSLTKELNDYLVKVISSHG